MKTKNQIEFYAISRILKRTKLEQEVKRYILNVIVLVLNLIWL